MPVISTVQASPSSGLLGGIGGALQGLGAGLGSIIGSVGTLAQSPLGQTVVGSLLQRNIPQAMPGGALLGQFQDPRVLQAQQASLGLLPQIGLGLGSAFLGDAFNVTGQPGIGALSGGACITPVASTTMRLPSRVDVPTVDARGNARTTTFKNMGQPVLWSGDLAACKRVKRASARARRAVGGR